jgi:hypothetical protein
VTLTTERTPARTAEAADEAADESADESADDASYTGKYRRLWRWLQNQGRDEISLTFADVEHVLGMPLPQSARRHPTHWYGYVGTALGRAICDAGWRASQVKLTDETVLFIRDDARSPDENESQPREHLTERQESA